MRRMNKNILGERIFKRIEIKVFAPDGRLAGRQRYKPPKGYGVTQPDIDEALKGVAEQVKAQFPSYAYKLVVAGDQCYNFVPETVQ